MPKIKTQRTQALNKNQREYRRQLNRRKELEKLPENWTEFERLYGITQNDVVKVEPGIFRFECATYVKKEDEANWNNHFSDEAREGITYYYWYTGNWKSDTYISRYLMPLRREPKSETNLKQDNYDVVKG